MTAELLLAYISDRASHFPSTPMRPQGKIRNKVQIPMLRNMALHFPIYQSIVLLKWKTQLSHGLQKLFSIFYQTIQLFYLNLTIQMQHGSDCILQNFVIGNVVI